MSCLKDELEELVIVNCDVKKKLDKELKKRSYHFEVCLSLLTVIPCYLDFKYFFAVLEVKY